MVERELPLEILVDDHLGALALSGSIDPDDFRAMEGPEEAGGFASQASLGAVFLVAAIDEIDEVGVATPRPPNVEFALERIHDHSVVDPEMRDQGFGRARDQLIEVALVPLDLVPRCSAPTPLGGGPALLLRLLVLDDVLGGLTHHASVFVEALASGAPRDLLEFPGRQQTNLLPVELRQFREDHGANGDVHSHSQRVGSADHPQSTLLRELLHQQSVLRKEAGVVKAHAVAEKAPHAFSVGSVEGRTRQEAREFAFLLPTEEFRTRQGLGELRTVSLGEAHDIDGGPTLQA